MEKIMIETFLAFSAFILAFLALIKVIVQFRLNAGLLTMRALMWILITLAIIALGYILINYLPTNKIRLNSFLYLYNLSTNLSYRTWLTNTSAFFDHIPYNTIGKAIFFFWNTALVVIVIYLFYKLITAVKFKTQNAKTYFNECSLIIASGIETDIQQLTSEICISIPTIFDFASQSKDSKTKDYAISLIALFSDELFCKKIVKHNPIALYVILETVINNCNHQERNDKNLIDRLILFLFIEHESQLHREEPYHGLGRFGTFKKLIFGNVNFLKSQYRPLSKFLMFSTSDFNDKAIKKYFEIIKFSLESYLNEGDSFPDIFYAALHNISEIIKDNIYNLKQQPDSEFRSSSSYQNLIACSVGMISIVHFIKNKTTLFPQPNDIQKENYSYHDNDKSIHGALANGIYNAIETFAMHHSQYESIRLLLLEIYPYSQQTSNLLKAIQERLDILLEEKIEENLGKLLYPAVTAALIYSFGLCEPNDAKISIQIALMTALKKKFIRAHTSIPEVTLDMLPNDTVFASDTKKLIRKHPLRWVRRKEIEELALEE
jgi:hypothetical protein